MTELLWSDRYLLILFNCNGDEEEVEEKKYYGSSFVPLRSRPHSVDSISDIGHGIRIHSVEEYNKIPVPWERD